MGKKLIRSKNPRAGRGKKKTNEIRGAYFCLRFSSGSLFSNLLRSEWLVNLAEKLGSKK